MRDSSGWLVSQWDIHPWWGWRPMGGSIKEYSFTFPAPQWNLEGSWYSTGVVPALGQWVTTVPASFQVFTESYHYTTFYMTLHIDLIFSTLTMIRKGIEKTYVRRICFLPDLEREKKREREREWGGANDRELESMWYLAILSLID